MRDPYTVLGVARGASHEDVRKAYRKLAKELHPDRNPGNDAAADRFKEISAAYDILDDADKRGKFDRGEIDASGQPRARGCSGGAYRPSGGARGPGEGHGARGLGFGRPGGAEGST